MAASLLLVALALTIADRCLLLRYSTTTTFSSSPHLWLAALLTGARDGVHALGRIMAAARARRVRARTRVRARAARAGRALARRAHRTAHGQVRIYTRRRTADQRVRADRTAHHKHTLPAAATQGPLLP